MWRRRRIGLKINGDEPGFEIETRAGQVKPFETRAVTLKETLGLTGTKVSCDQGACGACTVILNGKAVPSCMILTVECDDSEITTIEGLGRGSSDLDPLQQVFIEHTAFQCGFCPPGINMSARTVLNRNPDPGEEEIREALSGHLCRCISHYHVIGAVKEVTIARLEGAKRSKELLLDEPFTDTVVQRAAEEVLSGARPLTGNGFKIEIAKVLLRRAIRRCACGC